MATRNELEALTSRELHDRAFARAEHHVDLKFFYDLLRTLPAAEAAAGREEESSADIFAVRALFNDLTSTDSGELAEALRPFFIDYLERHGD